MTPNEPPDISVYRQYIEGALGYARGSHTFEDVVAAVARGEMQFWPGAASAIVTEIVRYPQHTTLNFFLAGGNLAELEAMTPPILAWAKAKGCATAVLSGRKGWERTFLTRDGWAPVLTVFEREL